MKTYATSKNKKISSKGDATPLPLLNPGLYKVEDINKASEGGANA
jgi:hypothetical protein